MHEFAKIIIEQHEKLMKNDEERIVSLERNKPMFYQESILYIQGKLMATELAVADLKFLTKLDEEAEL